MIELASPVYGERNVMLRYRVCDLIWRPPDDSSASSPSFIRQGARAC